jgi:ADP-heptose:LPS heptosyltransferase
VRKQSIERLVVIFPGALGDWLLALPALRALRARFASARATIVIGESLRALAALSGTADETASLDAADATGLFAGEVLPRWLAGRPVVYSWIGAADPDLRRRLAAVAAEARFFRIERGPDSVHAAAAYARALGTASSARVLAVAGRLAPPPSPAADALLSRTSAPVLAIHPGAGARTKRWDAAGFVQVAEWWRAAGGTVVEVAGPAEGGEAPLLGGAIARDWPLPDLAGLLARTALYVGNDSGVSHLAGAVGAAGVVLFGPTDPRRWRPVAGRLVALRARASGPAGFSLTALPAARVIAACRRRVALTSGTLDISVGSASTNQPEVRDEPFK